MRYIPSRICTDFSTSHVSTLRSCKTCGWVGSIEFPVASRQPASTVLLSKVAGMSDRTRKILEKARQLLRDESNCADITSSDVVPEPETPMEGTSSNLAAKVGNSRNFKRKRSPSADDSDFSDPFDSDDSVKDKTYQMSSNEEDSEEEESEVDLPSGIQTEDNSDSEVEETEETDGLIDTNIDATWHDMTGNPTDMPFELFSERCTLDPNISNTSVKRPLDVFKFFVNDELLELIVTQTNIFAGQQLSKRQSSKSRMKSWTDTNKVEICKFLGVTLAMGLTTVPTINLYWSKDPLYHNKYISSVMTRDRYLLILSCIHYANNETADLTNRLYKIEPLLSILLNNFQTVLCPGRVLVIDESMVPFRGRLHFRQYIPNKSHKYGVKLYKLCTSNGYTFNVKVYAGKGDTNPELGHSQSVVLKLLEPIEERKGRILFADNFYSSIPLCKELYREQLLYCGTLRSNRKGIPKDFSRKMKKGEILGKERDNIKIIKWIDKRPVLMISTHPKHTSTVVPTGRYLFTLDLCTHSFTKMYYSRKA